MSQSRRLSRLKLQYITPVIFLEGKIVTADLAFVIDAQFFVVFLEVLQKIAFFYEKAE
jgi:hypothetical protein